MSVATYDDGSVVILDSAGGLFSLTLDGSRFGPPTPVTSPVLHGAMGIKARARALLVRDRRGVHRIDRHTREWILVRTFYTDGPFAVASDGRLFLAPPRMQPSAPLIFELDAFGAPLKSYGKRDDGPYATSMNTAVLDVCGDTVAVGMRSRPSLNLFKDGSEVANITVSMPGREGLQKIEAMPSLVHPRPAVFALPTYITGLACDGTDIIVLLDTPRLLIYRFSQSGELIDTYAGADVMPGRHFQGLALAELASQSLLYTVSIGLDANYRLHAFRLNASRN